MTKRLPQLALQDILGEIEFLASLSRGRNFEQFSSDAAALRADAYSIQTISEAVRFLPAEWLLEFNEQPWGAIRSAGNKMRHECFRIDEGMLWDIVTKHSLALRPTIENIAKKYSAG